MALGSNSLVHNRALWDAQADGSLTINSGSTFHNDGVLRKSGGTGTTEFAGSSAFRNSGTLDVQTGTLQLAGLSNQFDAGSVYQGAGQVFVSTSSSFTGTQQTQNLVLGGGSNRVFTGTGALVQGQLGWSSGSFAGTWTLGAGQVINATDSGSSLGFTGAGTEFINRGLIRWNSSSDVRVALGATLRNQGTIELQSNVDINTPGGGGSFINEGLLVKQAAGNASVSSAGLSVENLGVIDVQQGDLRLPNAFVNRGTLTGNGSFSGLAGLINEGTLAPGSNGVGTLGISGNNAVSMAGSSTLAIDLHDLLSHDRLLVGQAFSLQGGTLALNCVLDCSLAVGDVLTIATFNGSAGGTFDQVSLTGFGSGQFTVQYDTGAIRLLVTQTVSAVPEPGTWALMLAGAALLGWRRQRRT